ncbi:hypothetical protein GCK32_011464 [Trichostrongylus colubriformis]|uniref:Uncharacterized protein n=1 Tax=Trichostrongylus colubriformis TaxID=6319 RepID=A0AAN8G1H4_TRICO
MFTNSLTMEEKERISKAADQFGKDHQKMPYYDTIFNTKMELFEAMDVAVMRYVQRIEYIKNELARSYAMEITIILECAFHVIFEGHTTEWIDDLVDQWAKQFPKLSSDAQESFAGEFPLLARELKKRVRGDIVRDTRDLRNQPGPNKGSILMRKRRFDFTESRGLPTEHPEATQDGGLEEHGDVMMENVSNSTEMYESTSANTAATQG